MKFCKECDNMYYISLKQGSDDDKDILVYYCRSCKSYEDDNITDEDVCVYTTQMKNIEQQYHHIVNKYTKYDPTLPRVDTIPCPNPKCESNNKEKKEGSKSEVIYIRYDDANQLYIYLCSKCNVVWKTEKPDDIEAF